MPDTPKALVVDCGAWGARALQSEAETWDARAAEATDDAAAAHGRAQAEACRVAMRNALHAAGHDPDSTPEPETWVELTPTEVEQRARDAEQAVTYAWDGLRARRDALLTQTDWTQLPGAPLTKEQKEAWDEYRQALRDLPANTTDPNDPKWPQNPSVAG